jgi:hypothetical protein
MTIIRLAMSSSRAFFQAVLVGKGRAIHVVEREMKKIRGGARVWPRPSLFIQAAGLRIRTHLLIHTHVVRSGGAQMARMRRARRGIALASPEMGRGCVETRAMSHKVVQSFIGQLLTDTELRERFVEAPLEVLADLRERGLELTETEIRGLIQIDREFWLDAADHIHPTLQRCCPRYR